MGEGSDAARAEVLAARQAVDDELIRLEASARAAVDFPAKVRRNPAKTAGLAAGAGFLLLGGPKKVLRGARNAIFGKPDPLPRSMLPKEIDKALGELGEDGARVRGTLEREFASYLKDKGPEIRERDLGAVTAGLVSSVGRPLVQRYGRQLVEQLLEPDPEAFARQLEKVRALRTAGAPKGAAADAAPEAATEDRPAPPQS